MNETAEMSIVISPEAYLEQIKQAAKDKRLKDLEIERLKAQLEYERMANRGEAAEPVKVSRKRREVTPETNTYSDFKSDGVRKAHAADSIRSYDDFKRIQKYFLDGNNVRDWALWTIGISLGFRISDLYSLKFKNFLESDKKTFRPRVQIYEQKTGKMQNCLITESVRYALTEYIRSLKWNFDLNGYVFASKKTGGRMYEECGWRILSTAGKKTGIPLNIGSHTMRKSFANIAACVDKSSIDMNSITKIQGLLNHSDQKVTLRYLGTYQSMFDKARIAVSDFVMGKSGVNEIVAGGGGTIDALLEKVESLEEIIKKKGDG